MARRHTQPDVRPEAVGRPVSQASTDSWAHVTFSTDTPGVVRLWWRLRARLRLPTKGRVRTR